MLDSLTLRVLAGVLLIAVILLLFFTSRRRAESRSPYVPVAVRRVPRFVHLVWLVASALVPLGAIVIAVVVPELIYGTALNFAFPGDIAVQLFALALFGLGGALLFWSDRHLGRYMVVDIALDRNHELITTGPYAYVRHPTYTAVLFLNLAAAFFFLHFVLVVNFFLVMAIATWRARLEEALLASDRGFGSRYDEYVRQTGRFLPKGLRRFGDLT